MRSARESTYTGVEEATQPVHHGRSVVEPFVELVFSLKEFAEPGSQGHGIP